MDCRESVYEHPFVVAAESNETESFDSLKPLNVILILDIKLCLHQIDNTNACCHQYTNCGTAMSSAITKGNMPLLCWWLIFILVVDFKNLLTSFVSNESASIWNTHGSLYVCNPR